VGPPKRSGRPLGGPAPGPVSPGRPPKHLTNLQKGMEIQTRQDVTCINAKKYGVRKKSTTIKHVCKKINLDCMPSKEKHQKHEI
jgi:hypothetical protein